MTQTLFWDIDTQNDFIRPDGKLYVTGAEQILHNLGKLTDFARATGKRLLGSVDRHQPGDAELSDDPDYGETFPPHCMAGSPGQEKVEETAPLAGLWIGTDLEDPDALVQRVLKHPGEVLFEKQHFDVYTNPNVDPVMNALSPSLIVLYGVVLIVCDAHAIEGFFSRRTAPIQLVIDAAQAIDPQRGERLVVEWKSRGVQVVTTDQVCGSHT